MNPCRFVRSHRTLSKLSGLVSLVFGLCVMGAAGRGTGEENSTWAQFALKRIPASAVHSSWQVPRIRNANGTSSNWSGYAVYKDGSGKGRKATPPTTFSSVTGSWVVPEVVASSSTNTYSSTWIGIDGYNDGTVEQIGTEQDWSNGAPHYYAWFEMYPKWAYKILDFPVSPGDEISADVSYVGKGVFTVTIINETTGQTFSTTQRSPSAQRLSAEWVEEAPWSGGVLPLADFGTVAFSGCSATTSDGYTGPIDDDTWWIYDQITMATSDGTVKAQPSDLSRHSADFSVDWKHE